MNADLDRSERAPQNDGDLLVTKISVDREHESFALRLWQALDPL